jgi:YidC/Oxa1 family membrane protein insertase
MDKNTTTGFLLIGAVLMAFLYLNKADETESPKETVTTESNEIVNIDSDIPKEIKVPAIDAIAVDSSDTLALNAQNQALESINRKKFGLFYKGALGDDNEAVLQNSKIRLSFSSKGARINSAELVELKTDGVYRFRTHGDFVDSINNPVKLFEKENSKQNLRIIDKDKYIPINTSELYFKLISSSESNLTYRLETDNSDQYLEFSYTLEPESYHVDYQIKYHNLDDKVSLDDVDLEWSMLGLSTEKLADDERMTCSIMYRYQNEGRDYIGERSDNVENIEGNLNWVAFKHKFFSSILISDEPIKEGELTQTQLESDDYTISYKSDLRLPSDREVNLKFFFGPNEYDLLDSYDAEMDGIINLGWGIFRWVNYIMIEPIFNMLKSWGLGFGLIILLLTLGKTDKNAAMKKQQETMALYKQTGVNPMAGCIPMIIQMPILIAVFRYFPASLSLRHKGFLWAEDLSSFDSILELGFEIPFYGDHVSLICSSYGRIYFNLHYY